MATTVSNPSTGYIAPGTYVQEAASQPAIGAPATGSPSAHQKALTQNIGGLVGTFGNQGGKTPGEYYATDPNDPHFGINYRPYDATNPYSYSDPYTGVSSVGGSISDAVMNYQDQYGNAPAKTIAGFAGGWGFGAAPQAATAPASVAPAAAPVAASPAPAAATPAPAATVAPATPATDPLATLAGVLANLGTGGSSGGASLGNGTAVPTDYGANAIAPSSTGVVTAAPIATGSGRNPIVIIVALAVVAFIAYYAYEKFAKHKNPL